MLSMQIGSLQTLLNSSAIRSHSSEVGTAINIGCSIFQIALPDYLTMPFIVFFPTREDFPTEANDSPEARYTKQFFFSFFQKCKEKWHNLRNNCMKKKTISKEKISGNGATVQGK
jgi:hypothetical protein